MIYLFDHMLQLQGVKNESEFINLQVTDKGNLIAIYGEAKEDLTGIQYIGCYHPDEPDNFLLFKLQRDEISRTKIIEGVHVFYDDLRGAYITDLRPDKSPVSVYLSRYLKGTGWEMSGYFTNATTSVNAYYISALEAVSQLIEETGIIIRPRIRMINGKISQKLIDVFDPDRFGSRTGRRFRHGVNGVEVTYQEEQSCLVTALVGRGAGIPITDKKGQETGGFTRRIMFDNVTWMKSQGDPADKPQGQIYIEDPEATALYGYPQPDGSMKPRIGIMTYDKIDDPTELLKKTYDHLKEMSRPLMTFKVMSANAEGVKLGDKVIAIRDEYSFETSITEAVHNLKNPDLTEYTFGDIITSATTAQIKKINNSILENKYKTQSLFANLQKQIDEYYWGEDGYNYDLKTGNEYGLPAGYYSFNAPINQNPTKVVYMGAGKMMISNEKDAAGKWIWKTAATGDGFYASSMFADFITGNLIRGSVIESIKRSTRTDRAGQPVSYWDLDNGHIESESANIYGDLYVDSKKYSYRHYNVGEWLDKVEELSVRADQTAAQASDAAASAYSAAQSAQTSAGNAYSAAQSAQYAANAANQALSTFLQPAVNLYGHPTSAVHKIWVVYYSGTYYLEVQPQGYSGATSWSVRLESISN